MIKPHCFGKDWFQSMSKKYRYNDLGIIEKVIRAFALLDLLARSGCPYIFKGGTCVGLILGDKTRRLSIDIDIICPPGTNVEKFDISKLTSDMNIDRVLPVRLNKLKKTRPEAFFYWYLIDRIL